MAGSSRPDAGGHVGHALFTALLLALRLLMALYGLAARGTGPIVPGPVVVAGAVVTPARLGLLGAFLAEFDGLSHRFTACLQSLA